jgi:chromate transporter
MNNPSVLIALTAHLALLSSISFGGFPTVLPDVRDFVVASHGWMTDQEFSNFFCVGTGRPGAEHDSDDEFTNTATTGVNYGIYASAASTNASAYAGYFSGNIYVTGTITMTSDRRAKKNIEAIPEMHWMESRRYGRSHSHGKRTACPTWDLLPRRWTMFTRILSSTAATKRWR